MQKSKKLDGKQYLAFVLKAKVNNERLLRTIQKKLKNWVRFLKKWKPVLRKSMQNQQMKIRKHPGRALQVGAKISLAPPSDTLKAGI